ncbi:MAG TPA: hypothetical protein VGM67_06245 [Gemmatimonadaceae bacterium]|jgi:hypothetical protein
MLSRRLRGIVVTATMFGLYSSVLFTAFTIVGWLVIDKKHFLSGRLSELAVSALGSFGVGAAMGALLASLLTIAERGKTVGTVSTLRFQLWGAVAGAVPMTVALQVLDRNSGSSPKWIGLAGITVLLTGQIGFRLAGRMLRLARRSEAKREAPLVDEPAG